MPVDRQPQQLGQKRQQLASAPRLARYPVVRRGAFRAPLVALALALSACSINGMGFASAEVIEAHGARIIRTETYGVALRSAADDAGVTVGEERSMAKDPVAAAPAPNPIAPTTMPKEEVVGAVESAMFEDENHPAPRSIAIQNNGDGTWTVTIDFQ